MTTDPPPFPDDARGRRPGVSVRLRLTASVALLVALALTGAGAIVFLIESQRLQEQTAAEIEQEFAELRQLQVDGIDPGTGESFTTVGGLLDTFLTRNVPDETELLVAWYGDRPRSYSPRRRASLVESAVFAEAVRPLVATNGTTTLTTEQHGEVRLDAQGVRIAGTDETGALVVATYLDEARGGLTDTMRTYTVVAALLLLLVTAVAAWQSGRLLAPIRVLRATAERIGEGDLSRRIPERGNDDLSALTRTVNTMLTRLEDAFTSQRQFLDDAGHELKTPLTVLRGHLELLSAGDPADVVETRDLLLDEVDRMSRLVGDLILLAKSERPDFLTTAPVALAALTRGVHAKATALGQRAWVLDDVAEGSAVLDEQRLTQALLQLADNAVKHTLPGATVGIGSCVGGHRLLLWVRDEGTGVPVADRERIFARFGRSAVPRGDEGFGLGLSIVRAIAEAHGGTAHVEDAEPVGARFVVTVPLVRPEDRPRLPGPPSSPRDEARTRNLPVVPRRPTDREDYPWPAS